MTKNENMKNSTAGKALLAVLIVWITGFFLGWIIFGVGLRDFYMTNSVHYDDLMKDMPDMTMIFLATLTQSILLVYVLYFLAHAFTFGRGFVVGAIVTLLVTASFDFYIYGSMNLYNGGLIFVDILINAILGGVLGGLAGWILGYRKDHKVITTETREQTKGQL